MIQIEMYLYMDLEVNIKVKKKQDHLIGNIYLLVYSISFALNGNIENPEVYDIDGIMRTYEKAVQNVDLYYPTDFAPVIKMARK